jgi:hypothetical protein
MISTHSILTRRTIGLFSAGLFLCLVTSSLAQPRLVSVQPANGSTEVPLNSSIVFTFDAAIEPATLFPSTAGGFFDGSLVWSANLDLFNFTYTWSQDNTVLTCAYTGELPGEASISWQINPASAVIKLGAEEDLIPVDSASGSFATAPGGCDPDGVPDGFGSIVLQKLLTYMQTADAAPVLSTDEPPAFFALADSPADNLVTAAGVELPGGETREYTPVFGSHFFTDEFESQSALDAAYPAGQYEITLARQTPPDTLIQMTMPSPSAYPPVPMVGNHSQAQSIDPDQDFTLAFNAFDGAGDDDIIFLTITDDMMNEVLSAPDPCVPWLLPNDATSFVIPSGTFEAGKTYTGRLGFARLFHSSLEEPPSFSTGGSLFMQTTFTLRTTGGVVSPQPQLSQPEFIDGGGFTFTVDNLLAGVTYRVESSSTPVPGTWTLLQSLTLPAGTSTPVMDGTATAGGSRFYRVVRP